MERHLHAEEMIGAAVYVAKHAGFGTVFTARSVMASLQVPVGGTPLDLVLDIEAC